MPHDGGPGSLVKVVGEDAASRFWCRWVSALVEKGRALDVAMRSAQAAAAYVRDPDEPTRDEGG